jgi:uncharacterized membrane protein YdbT with pleckstrin-like domain
MSFGLPYTSGRTPAGVKYYLLPQEKQVVTVRHHPAILIRAVLAVLAACAAGSTITVFTGIGGATLIAIWALVAVACAMLAIRVWAWLNGYFVLTRQRMILVPGVIKHRLVSIPARDIADIELTRSIPGRLAGYGLLTLKSGREGSVLRVIKYVPYPEQIYLEAHRALFGQAPD